jgi:carbonic anhydrase
MTSAAPSPPPWTSSGKDTRFPGSIGRMIEPIVPAVLVAQKRPGDVLNNAIEENVRRVVERLQKESEPMLLDPIRTGRLKVVGAVYSLSTGAVRFL